MLGIMHAMRVLVAVAVLGVGILPCLVCAPESGRPAVRAETPCHGTTPRVESVCAGDLGVRIAVAPAPPLALDAPPPSVRELVVASLRTLTRPRGEPISPADDPPLWLRHASLLV
jgi:hypothetical protein